MSIETFHASSVESPSRGSGTRQRFAGMADMPCGESLAASATEKRSRLWLWFVAVCLLQVAVWTAWITLASKHRVAEVPLEAAIGDKL
jgi:hypothetical protein